MPAKPIAVPGTKPFGLARNLLRSSKRPLAALGLHGGREIEAALALALLLVDDAEEVRADPVRAALFEGVAGRALLGGAGALFDGGGLQQFLDRLGRRSGGFRQRRQRGSSFTAISKPGFSGLWRRENRVGGKARHQHDEAGAENGADNFIEFEGVHSRLRLQAGKIDVKAGETAADAHQESGFRAAPSAGLRYRFARALATRINASNFPPIPIISAAFR